MPSFPEIPSLTQPPATAAAQKILAAYLSNHKLSPVAAAQLAGALTHLMNALVAGKPGAAMTPRLILQAPPQPASEPASLDDIVDDDALAEDDMDEVEDDQPEVLPRPRRASKSKLVKAATAPIAPEPPVPARKSARKTADRVETPVPAETSPKVRRAKKVASVEPTSPEPVAPDSTVSEPESVVSGAAVPGAAAPGARRRKPKAVAESQSAFDLQAKPETVAAAPAAAPAPTMDAKAEGEVVTKAAEHAAEPAAAEPAAPEPATPRPARPILRAKFTSQLATPGSAAPQPAALEPAAPRPILRAPQQAASQPAAPPPAVSRPAAPVRMPVVEDEDYDPYLGGPLPKSAILAPSPAPQALPSAAHNGAPGGGKKKRKRPPRPAHQRRAAREALQSGPTPANGGVTDQDDDYDPLI